MFWDNEIISLDRPVVIKGKELKLKLDEKLAKIDKDIEDANKILTTQFDKVVEGTLKSEQKKSLQKQISDLQVQKIWLTKLHGVINEKKRYALNLTEATTLNIITNLSDK